MSKLKQSIFFLQALCLFAFIFANNALAHPGRTDSSGCHTCRTNCSSWGLSSGEYHCHRAKSLPQPKEPIKSHYGDGGTGYTEPAPEYKAPAENKIETKNNNYVTDDQEKKIKEEIKKVEDKYYLNPHGFRERLTIQLSEYFNMSEEELGKYVYLILPNIYTSSDLETIQNIRREIKKVESKYYQDPHGFRERLTQQIAEHLGVSESFVGEHVYSMLPNLYNR